MSRYFFHLHDAATVALAEARDMLSHDIREGRVRLDFGIDVADEAGVIVHRLPFADAVTIMRTAD